MADSSILIVENEMIIALDLQGRLQRLGYDVPATAISGEEAIALAEQIQPDLILIDVGLRGEMDGIDTAEQIRARFGIPIVFLTAYTDAITRQRAEAVTPMAFLAKPFADDDLVQAIRIALNAGK